MNNFSEGKEKSHKNIRYLNALNAVYDCRSKGVEVKKWAKKWPEIILSFYSSHPRVQIHILVRHSRRISNAAFVVRLSNKNPFRKKRPTKDEHHFAHCFHSTLSIFARKMTNICFKHWLMYEKWSAQCLDNVYNNNNSIYKDIKQTAPNASQTYYCRESRQKWKHRIEMMSVLGSLGQA